MAELTNFHALLIGIDRYEPNNLYKDLRGCVRDIDLVADYLKKTLQVPSERIWRLTSPLEDAVLSEIRAARSEQKPTYENIIIAFEKITETAQSGEQVYIHYSGHGGRAVTLYPELKGRQHDEGIVPMDISSSGGRYLRDVEIATLLKRLTDKGCIVTVIFDSCHSGGATRGDCAIRGSDSNQVDSAPRSKDSLVASHEELLTNWRILTQADPELSAGWLPNADDYVFLAACRPSEYAYEYAVGGGQRNGALTYSMIDTLTSSTSVLTYKSLYNRVKGTIQSKFPQQLPMLTGNGDRLVFGDHRQYKPYTLTVIQVAEDRQELTLDAGLAAGLSSGTRFAIYPIEAKDFSNEPIAIAQLTDDIQAEKSTAQILEAAAGGIEVKGKIELGASAVMVAAPVDLVRKVFFAQKQAGDREQDLPAALVPKQTAALEKVRQALAGNGWIVEVKEGEESHYQVAVGRDGAYEICIGMPVRNLRPPLSIEDPEAPQKVCDRLVHLAKYQSVQALDNPGSNLSEYLKFQLCDKNKQPFPNPQDVTLEPGEVTYLKIASTYTQTLNVAVLDIEPSWEISQVPIQGDLSSFFPLEPGQETFTKLRLRLPAEYQQTQETLKIFATQGLANFQWLTLPPLDEQTRTRGDLNAELRTRSGNRAINPLNDLLTAIGSDLDNPPEKTRTMVYESEPGAEWITQEIDITVRFQGS